MSSKYKTGKRNEALEALPEIIQLAKDILKEVKVLFGSGKSPGSLASLATFLALQEEGVKTIKKEISEVFGINRWTLRSYLSEFKSRSDTDTST